MSQEDRRIGGGRRAEDVPIQTYVDRIVDAVTRALTAEIRTVDSRIAALQAAVTAEMADLRLQNTREHGEVTEKIAELRAQLSAVAGRLELVEDAEADQVKRKAWRWQDLGAAGRFFVSFAAFMAALATVAAVFVAVFD